MSRPKCQDLIVLIFFLDLLDGWRRHLAKNPFVIWDIEEQNLASVSNRRVSLTVEIRATKLWRTKLATWGSEKNG
ncbi:MAG: hypothetical protein VX910_03285 [Candidatus Latescibacterota bacterium]|nr:hypothetical protein [Candidatus Latescibacterota bacterium]